MPRNIQLRRLKNMAEKFEASCQMQGMAETSFISTARFQGYSPDAIEQIAQEFWPFGFAAHKKNGTWCFQAK